MAIIGAIKGCWILSRIALEKEDLTERLRLFFHPSHGDWKRCVPSSQERRFYLPRRQQKLHRRIPISTTIRFSTPFQALPLQTLNRPSKKRAVVTPNKFPMKHALLLFFSALLFLTASAQKTFLVGGKVVDSASQQPLAGASVFAQN